MPQGVSLTPFNVSVREEGWESWGDEEVVRILSRCPRRYVDLFVYFLLFLTLVPRVCDALWETQMEIEGITQTVWGRGR